MTYGYTMANTADRSVFDDAFRLIRDKLHFMPVGDRVEDVDGSVYQNFANEGDTIFLESNTETDYVGILSNKELQIDALHTWIQ